METTGFWKAKGSRHGYKTQCRKIRNCRLRLTEAVYLLALRMYCSIAIVMDGASGTGAITSTFRLASITAWLVAAPKAAIRVLFCLNFGKFFNNEVIPEGLKNTNMS